MSTIGKNAVSLKSGTTDFDETLRRGALPETSSPSTDAFLVVIYGPHLGRRYAIGDGITVGRDGDNDIVVESQGVSRRHAEFRLSEAGWLIRDLASTNGTAVNGKWMNDETTITKNGDLIDAGGVIFKLITGGDVEALFFDEVYRLTVYDGLTALHNRHYLVEFLDRELSRANRHERPLSFAMIDIDNFKSINDTHGHLIGDRLLTSLAQVLSRGIRREEIVARWGGEEFAFALPETALDGAIVACEKMRERVENESFEIGELKLRVTISVGLAELCAGMSRDGLVAAADALLYSAKSGGRNRVCAAGLTS